MLIIAEKTKGCVQILLLILGSFKRINIIYIPYEIISEP